MGLQFRLAQKLISSLGNEFADNWDSFRFGKEVKLEKKNLLPSITSFLNSKGYFHSLQTEYLINYANSIFGEYWEHLEKTFSLLEDTNSRELYVELLAYRQLGYKKVKLSSNNSIRKNHLQKIPNYINYKDFIDSNFKKHKLYLHNFMYHNLEINLYLTECGILNSFFLGQYRLNSNIAPKEGDYVIDCGACWGDSTIEFAASVGDTGKVFAYEFIPKSKEVLQTNINLNPRLADRVELIDNAVWNESGTDVYYKDRGPGSRVEMDVFSEYEDKTTTLSIDDLVKSRNLQKLDWIKMDIEGAEPHALKGGVETIKEFKPNLAISIYHNMDDFSKITPWLDDLGVGYKFYVRHFTIHSEETVLFATTY